MILVVWIERSLLLFFNMALGEFELFLGMIQLVNEPVRTHLLRSIQVDPFRAFANVSLSFLLLPLMAPR